MSITCIYYHLQLIHTLTLETFVMLAGLQGMDSTYPETRNIVRVLTQKLIESKDAVFTSQGDN